MPDPITLEFLAAQQRQMLDELATFRVDMAAFRTQFAALPDDIRVLSAMAIRQDNSAKATLDLLHALTSQQNRLADRLREMETQ